MTYKFKITKTYGYYGYPQAYDKYKVESTYLNGTIEHYGNQGWDIPRFEKKENNGYFWSLGCFLRDLFGEKSKIRTLCYSLKENETKEIILGEE